MRNAAPECPRKCPQGRDGDWIASGVDRISAPDRPQDAGGDCLAPGERPHVFVCGPTPLVEAVAAALVELGHDPALVKTERFGPTGGSA